MPRRSSGSGVEAVKIPRLYAELEVTRGSFYWHLSDLDELLQAVADQWAERTRTTLTALVEMEKLPPRERLAWMTGMLINGDFLGVERSIRNWAHTNSRISETVTATELHVHSMLHGALSELGFDPDEARIRSAILVDAGIGLAQGARPLPAPTTAERHREVYAIVVGIDITILPRSLPIRPITRSSMAEAVAPREAPVSPSNRREQLDRQQWPRQYQRRTRWRARSGWGPDRSRQCTRPRARAAPYFQPATVSPITRSSIRLAG